MKILWLKNFSSEAKTDGLSGARNSIAKKTKMIKKKTVRRLRSTTNFVPVKLFTFLSKFLIFLSLFQPPKTFSHVLHYPNLSKRRSAKFFSNKNFFFQKNYSFFFFIFFFFEFFLMSVFF